MLSVSWLVSIDYTGDMFSIWLKQMEARQKVLPLRPLRTTSRGGQKIVPDGPRKRDEAEKQEYPLHQIPAFFRVFFGNTWFSMVTTSLFSGGPTSHPEKSEYLE